MYETIVIGRSTAYSSSVGSVKSVLKPHLDITGTVAVFTPYTLEFRPPRQSQATPSNDHPQPRDVTNTI